MQPFPAVDPIPLPAPIWLIKLLHILTLALHFVAVEMLLGGLLIAVILSMFQRSPHASVAARALARRLTVVMTYVINLGVPPLLFAQVLYGRALYTSSVLIGVYWISVVFALCATYWLLYQFSARLEAGRSAWWLGLLGWILAGYVARVLSTNMTLMLRPEVWQRMYSASALGAFLPSGDPRLTWRWLTMLTGGLFIGGLWLVYLSGRRTFTEDQRHHLAGTGGKIATFFGFLYLTAGLWVAHLQPSAVKSGLASHPLYHWFGLAGYGWIVFVSVAVLMAMYAGFARSAANWLGWTIAGLAFLVELAAVIYRDAVRDLSLLANGFDVWDRVVVTNWSVVGLFLTLFVGGLGVIGWLVSIVVRAQKPMEGAA